MQSSVTIIEHMGTDQSVEQFARQSTDTECGKDPRRLLRHLMRKGHMSVLCALYMRVQVEVPVYVARQWMRHNQGIRYCERSLRYTELTAEQFGDLLEWLDTDDTGSRAFEQYKRLVHEEHVPKEEARAVLPLGTMTKFQSVMTGEALLWFLMKRADKDAQWEIRDLAFDLWQQAKLLWPLTMEAFEDYVWGQPARQHRYVWRLVKQTLATTDFFDRLTELDCLTENERKAVVDEFAL